MPRKRRNFSPAGRKSKAPAPPPLPDKPDLSRSTDFSSLKPPSFWH